MAFNIFAIFPPWPIPFESLRSVLTKANPPIRDESDPPRNVPRAKSAADVSSFQVSHWTDFNLETLMEAYGDILNEQVQVRNHAPTEPPIIRSLADLRTVGQNYIFPTLEGPIAAGARHIGIRTGGTMPTFDFRSALRLAGDKICYPTFTLCSGNDRAHVVGCFQLAKQWHSSGLLENPELAKRPIGRLVTCCNNAGTRYGFLLTNREVVVTRLSENSATRTCQVECQAISMGRVWGQRSHGQSRAVVPGHDKHQGRASFNLRLKRPSPSQLVVEIRRPGWPDGIRAPSFDAPAPGATGWRSLQPALGIRLKHGLFMSYRPGLDLLPGETHTRVFSSCGFFLG